MEEWRELPGHPDYLVSSAGRVASIRTLETNVATRYLSTNVAGKRPRGGGRAKARRMLIHRLVALAFIGPSPVGALVRHLDGDRQNNRADNLAYGTKKDNAEDARQHGTLAVVGRVGSAKITEAQALDILARYVVEGRQKLAAEYGLSVAQVSGIANGRFWKHLHGKGG